MAPKVKGLKLKPLPRAYTKVGRHHDPPASLNLLNKWPGDGQVRQVEVRGGVYGSY